MQPLKKREIVMLLCYYYISLRRGGPGRALCLWRLFFYTSPILFRFILSRASFLGAISRILEVGGGTRAKSVRNKKSNENKQKARTRSCARALPVRRSQTLASTLGRSRRKIRLDLLNLRRFLYASCTLMPRAFFTFVARSVRSELIKPFFPLRTDVERLSRTHPHASQP